MRDFLSEVLPEGLFVIFKVEVALIYIASQPVMIMLVAVKRWMIQILSRPCSCHIS